ncbi:MAG TPA: hypothetical protein VEH48_01535 [Candidatus Nitrosopolaris sp.]|nr:hypothetical protein [Candidatus Nitrosopolaris sp.]
MDEGRSKQTSNLAYKLFLGFVGLVVVCGLSFYGGVHYQKSKQTDISTSSGQSVASGQNGFAGGYGSRFGGQRPNIGSVTAVSSTSITIQSSFSGSSMTFGINSSTQVTENGQTVAVSNIQTGDNALVRTSGSGSTTASQIILNPGFGGRTGGSTPGST